MRIMYFGENKEEGTERVAVIRFTDDEFDLYKYIENYEHTYGDETRKFACGGLIGIERNEKGVWINESYISVDNFTDFIDFKANYKEAKKEFKLLKKQATETKTETTTDSEISEAETEETLDPEFGEFVYDVVIHNFYGCDTFTVRADGLESAEDKALKRMENEKDDVEYYSIDSIRIYKENSDELLKEIIFEPTETEDTTEKELEKLEKELIEPVDTHREDIKKFKEKAVLNSSYGEATEPLTVYQFERLTRTLYKSLFKAIGLEETRKIHFIISNNMVFFNYNDKQYKYYPSQCKIFKKCGGKYQRINWKDFADDNSPTDQKQALGRSPPFTPDIRSINIDKFKIKE